MLTHPPIKKAVLGAINDEVGPDSLMCILATMSMNQAKFINQIVTKKNKTRKDLKQLRTIMAHNMVYLYAAREVVSSDLFDEAMMDVQDYIQSSISKNSPQKNSEKQNDPRISQRL